MIYCNKISLHYCVKLTLSVPRWYLTPRCHNNCVPFNSLLSWNIEDDETVYIFVDDFIDEGILLKIPFGVDGFGNVFVVDCINDNKIKLWFHETDEYYLLADSFSEFVSKLHE